MLIKCLVSKLLAAALLLCPLAYAQAPAPDAPASLQDDKADKPDKPANKLTIGEYHFADTGNATDINLRHNNDYGDFWLGYYHSAKRDEHQGRFGWDDTYSADHVRVTPSAQIASRGYVAWSVNVETGETWFAGAGFGRTNLRPNWNLNFDPNDSWQLSAGRRWEDGQAVSLVWVRDDRENPDQRHLHAVYRTPLPDGQRLTVDVLHKEGLVDDALIHKWGATVTYDWPHFFVRLAYDPKVNFTSENVWRLGVGTRF